MNKRALVGLGLILGDIAAIAVIIWVVFVPLIPSIVNEIVDFVNAVIDYLPLILLVIGGIILVWIIFVIGVALIASSRKVIVKKVVPPRPEPIDLDTRGKS